MRANSKKTKSIDIFLVEDNEDDVLLMELALKSTGIKANTLVSNTGKVAMSVLKGLIKKDKVPDLIFLDINLPLVNGHEILKEIKSSPKTKSIPTVVFTSSDNPSDMKYSYECGADLYIKKPNNINEYRIIMSQVIEHFFIS